MAPIINNVYPQLGPVGQGVVISGENFISNQIQVFFGSTEITQFKCFEQYGEIKFKLPANCSGTDFFKVVSPEGEFTTDIAYTVGIPTEPSSVVGVVEHPGVPRCVYLYASNLTCGTTTINYNGTNLPVQVYTPNEGSFEKINEQDIITSFTLTTSNGSITHTID